MTDIPMIEPSEIVAGDSVQWKRSFSDYPAGTGWVLTYALRADNFQVDITGNASGDDHLVSLAATTTADYDPATYKWQAYVTKGSERYTVGSGSITVQRNFAGDGPFDSRGHVKKVLDAIEAVIEGTATKDQQEYQIGDRMLKHRPLEDLIMLREKYLGYYNKEKNAEKIKKGLGTGNRILVRI